MKSKQKLLPKYKKTQTHLLIKTRQNPKKQAKYFSVACVNTMECAQHMGKIGAKQKQVYAVVCGRRGIGRAPICIKWCR
jgi:hypothetical protein